MSASQVAKAAWPLSGPLPDLAGVSPCPGPFFNKGKTMLSEQKIVELYQGGKSLREVGAMVGRNHRTVWNLLVRNGVARRSSSRRRVSDEAIRNGYELVQRGLTFEQAGARIGCSKWTLQSGATRLGLYKPLAAGPSQAWSPAEIATVKKLYKTAVSAAEIAHRLGRTRNEVIGKAKRLGL